MQEALTIGAEYLEAGEAPARGGKTLLTISEITRNNRLLDCLEFSGGSATCLGIYGP